MAVVWRIAGEPGIGCTGNKIKAINGLGTTLTALVGANPHRQFIRFANPGTVTVWVAPERDGDGKALVPTLSSLGGAFAVFGGAVLTVGGECQLGWNGFARVARRSLCSRATSTEEENRQWQSQEQVEGLTATRRWQSQCALVRLGKASQVAGQAR